MPLGVLLCLFVGLSDAFFFLSLLPFSVSLSLSLHLSIYLSISGDANKVSTMTKNVPPLDPSLNIKLKC